MNLLSLQFGLFFLTLLNLSLPVRKTRFYKYFLLAASLIFYATYGVPSLLLLLGNLLLNYAGNVLIATFKNPAKFFLVIFIVLNVLFLLFFKDLDYLLNLAAGIAPQLASTFEPGEMLILFGVSFFTFKNIAHLVDNYQKKMRLPSLVEFMLYISYFPQIGAGPIERPEAFHRELAKIKAGDLRIPYAKVRRIFILLLSGAFKKLLLGTIFFNLGFNAFQSPVGYASQDLLIAVLAYTFYIYLDFSGYSDLSNAASMLLGFEEVENFRFPYLSTSVKEFWNRWHVSLSSWLRDYIYIPLGGNAKGELRKYFNVSITLLIGALWHGMSWNFLIWGALNAGGIIWGHFQEKHFGKLRHPFKLFTWALTFIFIMVSWVFFFTPNTDTAFTLFNGIIHPAAANPRLATPIVLVLSAFGALFILLEKEIFELLDLIYTKLGLLLSLALLCLLLLGIIYLMPSEIPGFVYFGF